MEKNYSDQRYKSNLKLLFAAAAIVCGLWFAYETIGILFLFFFAVVLTMVLNAPVMWLSSKKVPRLWASLLVFFAMLLFLGFAAWLVVPKILEQGSALVANLPQYYTDLKHQLSAILEDYPTLQKKLLSSSSLQDSLPSAFQMVRNLYHYSFSMLGGVFLMVMFFSIVLYMLIRPEPLIQMYLNFFSDEKKPKAAHALARSSEMMVGYMYSNIVVGTIEAVLVFIALSYLGVPGVWIWVGLALFAEMVPKLGPYIMAAPPVLIALAVDPMTALWVLIFYVVMNELMGDLVVPRVRASTMNLHPVSSLFVMLAMAAAFGIMGALVATPLTAFIKAFYETFFLGKNKDRKDSFEIARVLERRV